MLYGHLDEPAVGTRVGPGALIIRGWHRWASDPPLAVAACLGDRILGVAPVGSEPRPDVAEATGNPSLIRAGWTMTVDLGDVPAGPASIEIVVWPVVGQGPVRGGSIDVHVVEPGGETEEPPESGSSDDVHVAGPGSDTGGAAYVSRPLEPAGRFFASIDLPSDEEVSSDVFRVVGYALTEPHPVTSVEVLVNGRSVGTARLGLERPDLPRHHPVPHAPIAGFEHLIELPREVRLEGRANVDVVARTAVAGPVTVASRSWCIRTTRDVDTSVDAQAEGSELVQPRQMRASSPDRRLHLAALTHDMGYGGGQLWLTELLSKAGAGESFDCTIVTTKDGPLTEVMRSQGVDVHVTQPFPLDDAPSYHGRVLELCSWLREHNCDAALANTFLTFPGVDAALRAALPVAWAIHESWTPAAIWSVAYPEGHVDSNVRRRAEAVLRNSHALAFEAEATRLQYEPAAGPGRTIVIPYGIDVQSIEQYLEKKSREAARRDLEVPAGCRVLLVMGTTEPRKGQTLLAEAFQQVAGRHRDALLVMVGDTGTTYADGLRDYVEQSGVSHQIRILPVVKDTYQWYRAADVLVCASDVESLPRSVLEAMCFGLPVLATSVFGLPELIEDGRTGFLFEPRDLRAAASALERVLEASQAELDVVAARGRELVREEYDSREYATDFLALIEGLRRDQTALPSDVLVDAGRLRRG